MLEQEILKYGYALLFVGGLFEADAFLITAAFLAHRHYLDIRVVIPVSMISSFIANQFWFRLGRSRGRAFFERRAATDPRFARIQGWLARQGSVLLLSSRFLWGLRSAIPAAYGAVGSDPWLFTRLDGLGVVVWGIVVGLAAYVFGGALGIIVHDIQRYEVAIAVVLVIGLAAIITWRSQDRSVVFRLVRRQVEIGGDTDFRAPEPRTVCGAAGGRSSARPAGVAGRAARGHQHRDRGGGPPFRSHAGIDRCAALRGDGGAAAC